MIEDKKLGNKDFIWSMDHRPLQHVLLNDDRRRRDGGTCVDLVSSAPCTITLGSQMLDATHELRRLENVLTNMVDRTLTEYSLKDLDVFDLADDLLNLSVKVGKMVGKEEGSSDLSSEGWTVATSDATMLAPPGRIRGEPEDDRHLHESRILSSLSIAAVRPFTSQEKEE